MGVGDETPGADLHAQAAAVAEAVIHPGQVAGDGDGSLGAGFLALGAADAANVTASDPLAFLE